MYCFQIFYYHIFSGLIFSSPVLIGTTTAKKIFPDKYMEEYDHTLFGSNTTIAMVRSNDIGNKGIRKKSYSAGRLINNYEESKNLSNVRRFKKKNTVYPEILVVVDYQTFEFHKKNLTTVTEFIFSLFNGYDLIFRQMSDPKVRLNIAGIIVAGDDTALPFINKSSRIHDDHLINIRKYITESKLFKLFKYDIVDVILYRKNIDDYQDEMRGVAYSGCACCADDAYNLVLTRTTGGFTESSLAVHEIAHTFNASHDEDVNCGEENIMSFNSGKKSRFFSECSIATMREYLKSSNASCLRNKPYVGTPLPKVLPGKILNRDEQCRRALGGDWVSSQEYGSDCELLNCEKTDNMKTRIIKNFSSPPAEGSKCSKNKICLQGVCTIDPLGNTKRNAISK